MWVKLTNCKYYTGGGKRIDAVPARIRHNQNIQINLAEKYRKWSDNAIKRLVERIRKYGIITSKETKVIRDFDSYKFHIRQMQKKRLKWALNLRGVTGEEADSSLVGSIPECPQ